MFIRVPELITMYDDWSYSKKIALYNICKNNVQMSVAMIVMMIMKHCILNENVRKSYIMKQYIKTMLLVTKYHIILTSCCTYQLATDR